MVAAVKTGFPVRPMSESDIDAVLDIERAAYPFPWTGQIFRDCLQVGYRCFVIEENGEVAGYAIIAVAVEECHILNICIDPRCNGRGLGRYFMRYLMDYARGEGARTAYLEVRPSNLVATQLYWSLGFEQVGVRKDYYPCTVGREDALVLACPLTDASE